MNTGAGDFAVALTIGGDNDDRDEVFVGDNADEELVPFAGNVTNSEFSFVSFPSSFCLFVVYRKMRKEYNVLGLGNGKVG